MIRELSALVDALGDAARARQHCADGEATSALLALLEVEYQDGGAAAVAAPDPSPILESTGAVFDLSALDLQILVTVAAADLDVRFSALYGLLLGSDHPQLPSVGLVLELCGQGSLSVVARQRLGPAGPLRRHRLVAVEGKEPLLWRSARVPERVVAHLLGDTTPAVEVADLLVDVVALATPEAELLGQALATGVHLGHVRSAANRPGPELARGAFAALDVASITVDLRRCSRASDPATLVTLAAREAGLQRAGLIVTGADSAIATDRSLLALLERCPMPTVVVDELSWDAGWVTMPAFTVTAPEVPPDVREGIWREALSGQVDTSPGTQWADLTSLRLTPQEVATAVRTASVASRVDGREFPSLADLHAAAHACSSHALQGAAQRIQPRATLDDLVLDQAPRAALAELVEWARHRELLLANGRLAGKGNKGRGLTALFAGSPGTGKTLAAEAVAGELGVDLYVVDLPSVIDKYIGETEKKLERVIQEAEGLNVVLFFDEADSLFGARAEVRDARDRYANQGVSYLLQRIERFEGVAILATNLRGNIDPAFSRRLHHVVTFVDPDAPTRRRLWIAHLDEVPAMDPLDEPDLDWLAERVEVTGGTIRNVVLSAAFTAASNGDSVGMRHLWIALQREYHKLGRRMLEMAPARVDQPLPIPDRRAVPAS